MNDMIKELKLKKAAEAQARAEAAQATGGAPDESQKNAEVDPAVFTEPTDEEKAAAFAKANPAPPPPPAGPPGSYRPIRLQRFFKASGQKIEPNADGFFVPADVEEATILAHFATQYDMVEFQE